MTDITEIIEREFKEYSKKYPNAAMAKYLNNFFFRLPDSRFDNNGYYRRVYTVEIRKKSFRELTEDFAKKHGLYFARESSKHSELYLNQSPEEFYATVDSLIEDCGLNLETIQQMHEGTNTMTVLNDYAFPVYIKLREMGYTHMELTS